LTYFSFSVKETDSSYSCVCLWNLRLISGYLLNDMIYDI
jgi:hypothetical protein